MAHPEIDEIKPDQNEVALITLVDEHAPYKGTWSLVRHASAHGRGLNGLEAIHTTYHPHHREGCQIERVSLAEQLGCPQRAARRRGPLGGTPALNAGPSLPSTQCHLSGIPQP
jgi:hypothetical protein